MEFEEQNKELKEEKGLLIEALNEKNDLIKELQNQVALLLNK